MRESERCYSGRHGEHGVGDHCFHGFHLRLGAGVLHAAHRLLEGVHHRRHGHHHRHLLGQPLEDVRYRLHGRLQLQGLPLHAGSRRSASRRPPPLPLAPPRPAGGAPADPTTPGGTPGPDSSKTRPRCPPQCLKEPGRVPGARGPPSPDVCPAGGA